MGSKASEASNTASKAALPADPIPVSRFVLFALIALGGLFADLGTKSWAFSRFGMPGVEPTYWLWQDVAGFQTSLNEGALFGMGQGWTFFFAGLSIVAGIVIVYWLFVAGAARDLLLTIALAFVMSGVLGNFYDRVGLPGLKWHFGDRMGEPVYAVRDFILVMIGDWPWPTFNIADSFLVCGAALLLWRGFVAPPEQVVKK